ACEAPFPAPARQTVHALLAHTAYRHRSPAGMRCHPAYVPGQVEHPEPVEPRAIVALAPSAAGDAAFAIVEDRETLVDATPLRLRP
ncbi:hypothetical protein, partial [Streptomyces sp. NPDC002346]